jgi:hypothetical protein
MPGNEAFPRPASNERVVFVDHMVRGLSFPVHPFLRGLLYIYGVQLHDLALNSLLHITCFIVMCECFLGIHPHWGLWKKLFLLKRHRSGGEVLHLGGVGIQVRGNVEYFTLKQSDSVQGWRKKWFYLCDEPAAG